MSEKAARASRRGGQALHALAQILPAETELVNGPDPLEIARRLEALGQHALTTHVHPAKINAARACWEAQLKAIALAVACRRDPGGDLPVVLDNASKGQGFKLIFSFEAEKKAAPDA